MSTRIRATTMLARQSALCTHEPDLSGVHGPRPIRDAATSSASRHNSWHKGRRNVWRGLDCRSWPEGRRNASGTTNRSLRTCVKPSGSAEPESKETTVTAVREFFHRPGSGLILVSLLPPSIRKFGTVISCAVQQTQDALCWVVDD